MGDMFSNNPELSTIYVSSTFVTTALPYSYSGNYMFNNCTSLVGGNGTTYQSSSTNQVYAWIDGRIDPTTGNSRPGYFSCHDE